MTSVSSGAIFEYLYIIHTSLNFGITQTWGSNPVLFHFYSVTLGKLLKLFELQFAHL